MALLLAVLPGRVLAQNAQEETPAAPAPATIPVPPSNSSSSEMPANTAPPTGPANTAPVTGPTNLNPPPGPASTIPPYSLPTQYTPGGSAQPGQAQAAAQTGRPGGEAYDPQPKPQPPAGQPTAQPRPQAIPQSIPQAIPQEIPQAIPQRIPQTVPRGEPENLPQGQPESAAPRASPGAMAAKAKVPSASDYEDVHVQPRVSSEEKAKFDPNSSAAVEAGVNPSLRTHTKPFRIDVELVLVPVTVTDPYDRPVLGLGKDNFAVFDNGERQAIESFSCEDAPVSVGVILDTSGSMKDKLAKAREAIGEFFTTTNPDDEFFLISFADKPYLVSDFTSKTDELEDRLFFTLAKGRTALLDAIYLGIAKMRHARQRRRALLIISDGADNRSRYNESEIKALVREADVQIYAIGIFDANPRTEEERYGPVLLSEITEVTGGRTYTVDKPADMSQAAEKIGLELRNQYVLGYRPSKPGRDGKWRKVRVKLSVTQGLPSLTVYAKMGYYAANE